MRKGQCHCNCSFFFEGFPKKTSYNLLFQNYKITVFYTANLLQRARLIISNSSAMQKTEWETDL